jgi:hypothetical protein
MVMQNAERAVPPADLLATPRIYSMKHLVGYVESKSRSTMRNQTSVAEMTQKLTQFGEKGRYSNLFARINVRWFSSHDPVGPSGLAVIFGLTPVIAFYLLSLN